MIDAELYPTRIIVNEKDQTITLISLDEVELTDVEEVTVSFDDIINLAKHLISLSKKGKNHETV